MTAQSKRRIQVASFSFNDVAKGHVAAFVLGATLIMGAGVAAWVSGANAQAAASAKDAARMLITTAGEVIDGSQLFAGGGAGRLAQATQSKTLLLGALRDLRASAGSPVAAPSLKRLADGALVAANNVLGPLAEMDGAIRASAQLSQALGESAPNFAALSKAIRTAGKGEAALARSSEAAARLHSYAEAGFGVASTPRVDYELRTLNAEIAHGDLRTGAGFVAPLVRLSQGAASQTVTSEQLTRALTAATAAKAAGEQLGSYAEQSDLPSILAAAAGAMLLAGLAMLGVTLSRVLDDFGRRYHRGVQQFRGGEAARQVLTQELRAAAETRGTDFSVSEAAGELAEISRLINTIAQGHADYIGTLLQAAQSGLREQATATSLLAEAEEQSLTLAQRLREVAAQVARAAEVAHLVSLDAQAASRAADEASLRSADANQVAQDAASRMEALREGLQETAKGVKRLGERTQEIDGVVDTMELLSEQIGVLALNASLEAERAGEAGAGFRAVAREVQSLAHRSEDALKQISGLVQGAQADARAASALLDRSTHHAVSGSNVAAVSHALLVALPTLASGVEAMTRSICAAGRDGQDKLRQAQEQLRGAASAAGTCAETSAQARSPLARMRKELQISAAEA